MTSVSFFVMPGAALRSLRDEISIAQGDAEAYSALHRYGERCGEDMARQLEEKVLPLSELADDLPTLVAQMGLGRIDKAEVDGDAIRLTISDSLEKAHLSKTAKGCAYTVGYMTGLLTTVLGKPYKAEEVPTEDELLILSARPSAGPAEPLTSIVAAASGAAPAKPGLREGCVYLVKDEGTDRAFETFKTMLAGGRQGLVVTREFPKKIAERYGIAHVPAIWLSSAGTEGSISPEQLSSVYHELDGFIRRAHQPIIILSGIEYLASHNSFPSVLKFIQLLNEQVAIRSAVMLIPVSPLTLDQKDLKVLERELEVLKD